MRGEELLILERFLCEMSIGLLLMERREFHKAFPHLNEWCNKGLWLPSCSNGSVCRG